MNKNNKLVLLAVLLSIFVFHDSVIAQSRSQREQIARESNVEALQHIESQSRATNAIKKKEALILAEANNWEVSGTNDDGSLFELMRVENGVPIYYTTDNTDAAKATRANKLHSGGGLGLNVEGQGMTAHVWDGGIARVTHREYDGPGGSNRVIVGDTARTTHYHSGHVVGTIASYGYTARAKGMAPKSTVYTYEWTNDEAEVSAAAAQGMLISNHSYGLGARVLPDNYFGRYSDHAAEWDGIIFNAPYYLMVKSAGNDHTGNYNDEPLDGNADYDDLTGLACAKNNLVVANVQDPSISASGDLIGSVTKAASSSHGPTDDYRIKPDISANGYQMYSTAVDNDSDYKTLTGTSMAAPNATGTLLLLQQHYKNVKGSFMKGATLKGLAMHTADDILDQGPDAKSGWGLMNAKKAAEAISSNSVIIKELTLNNNDTYTFTVQASGKLQASICWMDAPGPTTLDANVKTPVLVNDLDIRVTKSSSTYYPWKLTGVSTNTRGDNNVDPYERVDVDNASGTYTITVSHKGSLEGRIQNYSLVVTGISGATIDNQPPSVPTNLTVAGTSTESVYLTWNASSDNVGVAGYEVYVNNEFYSKVQTNKTYLTGLNPGTSYSVKVRAFDGSNNKSDFASTSARTRSGSKRNYCSITSESFEYGWIERVKVGDINNVTSKAGYSDFTNLSVLAERNDNVDVEITRAWKYSASASAVTIWIDWNQDGDFTDSNEKVLDLPASRDELVSGSFRVPSNASAGATRMRVVMKTYSAATSPCGSISSGEIEDYSIAVLGTVVNPGDTQAPTTPSNLSASNVTANSATLSWTASTDNVGVAGYEVYNGSSRIGTTAGTSYNVTGLTASTTYNFSVRAYDAAGNKSSSATKSVTTSTDGGGGGGCKNIKIEFTTDNYPSESSWTLKNASGTTVMSGTRMSSRTYTYTSEECLPIGCYTFTANDSAGDGICCRYGNGGYKIYVDGVLKESGGSFTRTDSKRVCSEGGGGDTQAPTTPTALTASDVTKNSVNLSWAASTDNVGVTGYEVYNGSSKIATVTSTNYSVTGLAASTRYTFAVLAYDAAGNKSSKASKSVTTSADSGGGDCKNIKIEFTTDNYPSESSWTLKNSAGTTVMSGSRMSSRTYTYTTEECLPIGCYTFTANDSAGDGICCRYGNGGYKIYVDGVLKESGGSFTRSDSKRVCSEAGGGGGGDTQAPTTPTALTASDVTKNSVNLSWGASTDNVAVTGYEVYNGSSKIATVTSTNYSVTGLAASTSYTFAVLAYDAAGNKSAKASKAVTTSADGGGGDCKNIKIEFTTDNYPSESSWTLKNSAGTTVMSGSRMSSRTYTYTTEECLPVGCYTFTANDSAGDGICCRYGNGGYKIYVDGVLKESGGSFTRTDSKRVCSEAGGGGGGDTQAPTTPTSLTASGVTASSVNLSWGASTDNVAVTGYEVYNGATKIATVTTNSYSVSGLSANTNYTFGVLAFDAAGNKSARATKSVTTSSSGGGGACKTVKIEFTTDRYPTESSWTLKNSSGTTVMSSTRMTSRTFTYNTEECLPQGCYTLTVNDSAGDGLCCRYGNGGYKVYVDGVLKASGASFTRTESKEVCVTAGVAPSEVPVVEADPSTDEVPSLSVYPNPIKDDVVQIRTNIKDAMYKVFDSRGSLISNGALNGSQLDASTWVPGVYLIQVSSSTGEQVLSQRIVRM